MKYLHGDQLSVEFMLLNNFNNIREEYLVKFLFLLKLIIMLRFLAGEKKITKNIGFAGTHGEHPGDNHHSLEYKWVPII